MSLEQRFKENHAGLMVINQDTRMRRERAGAPDPFDTLVRESAVKHLEMQRSLRLPRSLKAFDALERIERARVEAEYEREAGRSSKPRRSRAEKVELLVDRLEEDPELAARLEAQLDAGELGLSASAESKLREALERVRGLESYSDDVDVYTVDDEELEADDALWDEAAGSDEAYFRLLERIEPLEPPPGAVA